jgi:DNA-binding NtrC family response regulator/Flp pilus assembly protein TadD
MNLASAYGLHQAGRYADAARGYRALLDRDPENAGVQRLLGVMHRQCRYSAHAAELTGRAIGLRHGVAASPANLAEIQPALDQHEQAAESCHSAPRLRPDHSEAFNNLGLALYELEQDEEAITQDDAARALRPDFARAQNNRSNAMRMLGKTSEAIEAFRPAIAQDPSLGRAPNPPQPNDSLLRWHTSDYPRPRSEIESPWIRFGHRRKEPLPMIESTASLLCEDAALIETIQEVMRSIVGIRLRMVARIEELFRSSVRSPDAIILIHVARGGNGASATRLLRMLTAARQSVPVLVLSEEHHTKQTLELLRLGASDCLSRPLDLHRLAYLTDVLTVRARYAPRTPSPAAKRVGSLGADARLLFIPQGAIGKQLEHIQRVAPQKTTVLLSGETGTGKTYLARIIHELSPRNGKPFLVLNCGMLSANLIESELFGHVKGAFTGADRDRTGKFAEVGAGTLLLDEIDALPLALQAKLLRALEERVFEPVGSNRSCVLQARLIAASNRNLDQEVAAGRFRADLYYRLNVVNFVLPPLRERRAVLAPLAEHFLTEFTASNGRSVHLISDEALRALQEYTWPGNVRELRNVIERAVALCAGPRIELSDLPEVVQRCVAQAKEVVAAPTSMNASVFSEGTLAETKDEAEYLRIVAALRQHNNNRLRAAAELGISRMTLYNRLHRFGLFEAI